MSKPCYVVQVNPITNEESVIGVFRTIRECAKAMETSASEIGYMIRRHSKNAFGCFVMAGRPKDIPENKAEPWECYHPCEADSLGTFPARLRAIREFNGQSQKTVSELCGLHPYAVYRYETRNTIPDIKSLIALSDFFHVSIDYLVRGGDICEQ